MIKVKCFRSKEYLRWVKQQPCVICGAPSDDPHHIIGRGNMSGMGMTAPDSMVMPVCRQHHNEIHQAPELWDKQWQWIAQTINSALQEGVLEVRS